MCANPDAQGGEDDPPDPPPRGWLRHRSDTRGIVQSTQRIQARLLEVVAVEEVVGVERINRPSMDDVHASLLDRAHVE